MGAVEDLLNEHEGRTLEFKRDLSSPKAVLKTIVAFANTAGGTLLIGVNDDKVVTGLEDPLAEEERLTSLIADSISPLLLPRIKIMSYSGRSLLAIEVPFLAYMGPFYLRAMGEQKGVFVLLGSSTRQATGEIIRELMRSRHVTGFDALPCLQTSEADLDRDILEQVFSEAGAPFTTAKLKTLKVIVPYGEDDVLSNAGVILFAKQAVREKYFPMAYLSCARFAGTDKANFVDRFDTKGLVDAIESVPEFIRRNTRMGALIRDIKREDIPEYPVVAVREALLNALMHTDYSYSTMHIFVSLFDDRLEIRNPGCLPPGMTLKDLKQGVSQPRNVVIARIFQVLGWVESFGTGYQRMVQACEQYHYPLPDWRETGTYIDIIFKPIAMEEIHNLPDSNASVELIERQQVLLDKLQATFSDKLLGELKQMLNICREPKSAIEVMEQLERRSRDKFRASLLNPALALDLLSMTSPDRPNSPVQQYRLTITGEAALEALNHQS